MSIPWDNLVKSLEVKESKLGRNCLFSPKGRIALLFLKHYAGCSDRKLIEQLNSNLDYQFFCDIQLGFQRLTNYKIVSQIRCELSEKLNIESLQKVLYNHWKPHISSASHVLVDATCYESELRYPTIQKLLWEAVSWLYKQIGFTCRILGIKKPRSRFLKWKKRYFNYSKMRRKTASKRRSLTRALLRLLHKFIEFEKQLHHYDITFTKDYYKRVATIQKVYEQQLFHFETGERIKDRIVSIGKNYVRPIKRGKEVKSVEFGAKVNKLQIDGINFIEHLNFDNFNEGTRLQSTIYTAQSLTHKKTKLLGADAIYATNKNRNFVSKHNIKTDFKPKGRLPKNYQDEKKLKALITKERATRLEGSFGNEKEHYLLRKIKAKTKANEILWIFLGIHTANALEIGRRMTKMQVQQVA